MKVVTVELVSKHENDCALRNDRLLPRIMEFETIPASLESSAIPASSISSETLASS